MANYTRWLAKQARMPREIATRVFGPRQAQEDHVLFAMQKVE